MATILKTKERLSSLKSQGKIEAALMVEVARFSGILVDLQQNRLEKGLDTLGNIIGRYSQATESIAIFGKSKPIMPKKAGQPFNFQWTGGFFDGMFVKVNKKEVVFGSKSPTSKDLLLRYSDLYGLDRASQVEFASKYIYPAFMSKIRSQLEI